MPNNITDVSTWTNPIQTVADGDAASAANFALAVQGLSNRTKYLRDILLSTGVTRIRSVADTTALKALTGMADGDVAFVKGNGVYYYIDPSATAESLPWIVQPTSGTGRWVHGMNSLRDAAYGFPSLDASSKIAQSAVPYRFFGMYGLGAVGTFSTSSGAFVDATGFTTTISSCKAGDQILFSWAFTLSASNNTEQPSTQIVLTEGAGSTTYQGPAAVDPVDVQSRPCFFQKKYDVAADGNVTIKVQLKAAAATGTAYISAASVGGAFTALVIRP